MKTKSILCALFLYLSLSASAKVFIQEDSLGLPGDNLDLYGVLDLFKKSENPEEFEKALNKEDNKLNNLDLNGDGKIDYIRVIDHNEKNAHTLVLQVSINDKESQDVAVIEIEKNADDSAHLQIVGDEDLYGKDYIIEPADESTSKKATKTSAAPVIVNVYTWPAVRYVYRPAYVVWVSPWGWHAYPVWWTPWTPVYWAVYHPHWYGYHAYHHRVYTHNVIYAHNMYYGHRVVSKNVVYQHRSPTPSRKVENAPRKSPVQERKVENAPRRSQNKIDRQQKPSGRKREAAPRNNNGRQKQSKPNQGRRK
jgi:hypothetical protein